MTLTGMKKHIGERTLRQARTGRRGVEAETTRPIDERNSPLNTRFNSTTQVSLPSDTEIRITRDFNAPRSLLWQAHVDPQLFRRWIGGYPGWSMPVCELDVRPGGAFRWRWRQDEEGKEFGFFGDYREVDAPATIVSAEYFDPGSFGGEMPTSATINRTTFTEQNGVTTLVVLIE